VQVVVTGASGNVGTSVLRTLTLHGEIAEIVGIARRLPRLQVPKVEWVAADIVRDHLVPLFAGAPRHKAAVERLLDRFEHEHPGIRCVRLRPGLIFKSQAASEQRRYFAGPLAPTFLLHPRFIPVVPDTPRLRFQAVHADDVAQAYCLALVSDDARGAYNVAAEPVLDPDRLAELLHARKLPVPERLLHAAAAATWPLRLQPSPVGCVDMALNVPVMSAARIRGELGWEPRKSAGEALLELLRGMRKQDGIETPPLGRDTSGPLRIREFLTGIGGRNP
jgi:UDP-glucose 4-epimerase